MAKVLTPKGKPVTVRRRWYPWPNFFEQDKLETWGVSESAAKALSHRDLGDRALAGFLTFFLLLLPLFAGAMVFFTVMLLLTLGGLTARYLALPWTLEVLHEGRVVASEECEGYSRTTRRVGQVAELYASGQLPLPAPRVVERPEPNTALPVSGPTLPELPEPEVEVVEEESAEAPAFELLEEPDLPQLAPPAASLTNSSKLETPLRRALRALEEEEKELARKGVQPSREGHAEAKRATPKKSRS